MVFIDFALSFLAPAWCRLPLLATSLAVACLLSLALVPAEAETLSPPESKWPMCRSDATQQKLSFVHISDMHANYNASADGSNPISRVRGYYQAVKKDNPFTLFTNSGDDYEKGSIAEELSQGRSTREVVHALGYDVRTLGNHDFAWGIKELLLFSHDPKAVVLSSNTHINRQKEGPLRHVSAGFTDFTTLTVGCVKIGFFGLTARPYDHQGGQTNGPVYPELPSLEMDFDFVGIAEKIIARHRHEVDILILVSHMGVTDDIAVARQTQGIDLILGGHSHTTLEKPLRIKDTTIIHTGAEAEHIGRYDLLYDLKGKVIAESDFQLVANVPEKIADDEKTRETLAALLHRYQRQLHEPVAEVKTSQSQFAMARIAALAAVEKLSVDAAFVGSGSVWREWHPGKLTRQDIFESFKVEREPPGTPGASSLYLMEVSGADLLHARTVLKDSAYWGPTRIDPLSLYTVAMQKPQAFEQQRLFSRNIAIAPPRPETELWEVVAAFADDLNDRNLALDEGSPDRLGEEIVALLRQAKTNPAF